MNQQKEKIILNWLKGELEESELLNSISREEMDKYRAILSTVDNWEPDGSLSDESRLKQIFASKETSETKVISLNRTNWFVGIAASIALVAAVAIVFLRDQSTVYLAETENLEILLPDNTTTAILSPGSKLSYEDFDTKNRNVEIEGRVYFDVTEKGPFKVEYQAGSVNVLGTQFEVLTYDDFFETSCYEGKVSVEYRRKRVTLQQRERVASAGNDLQKSAISQNTPGWLQQEVERFENDLLSKVIKVIEVRYDVQVEANNVSTDRRFTGSIPANNLEEACKKVFSTLGISYDIKEEKVILTE